MLRNLCGDGRFSDGQESSWIGLLSRPALSLLRTFGLWSDAPAVLGGESDILRQFHEASSAAARCQRGGASGGLDPGGAEREPELQPRLGSLSSVRTVINQVLVNSLEGPPADRKAWGPPVRGGSAGPSWGGFLRPERAWFAPPPVARTKAPPVLEGLRESAGPPQLEPLASSWGGPLRVQNMKDGPGPEQDNGYSSLEEELTHRGLLLQPGSPSQEPLSARMEETPKPGALAPPQCGNKNIAFIMGCPCSDDDESSQSDPEDEDDDEDDDDDGFDSEGSAHLSDSSDEDEDEDDEDDEDSDSERLWTSWPQSLDPHHPQNFPEPLQTSSTAATPPPPPAASPQDSWDDSTSASEADEAESLRLLSSFSVGSDPYSPLNFQAPLMTAVAPPLTCRTAGAPHTYCPDRAEERMDSGFAEAPPPRSCKSSKKVRFCEDVEEFFASGDEERRGPWEQLARDRCRFHRRCQEVEQSIRFCLQPQHRRRVLERLSHT